MILPHFCSISILSFYAEGDSGQIKGSKQTDEFQSSPSIQRETGRGVVVAVVLLISILSLYTEGDSIIHRKDRRDPVFQSSPSIQRETIAERRYTGVYQAISILSLYTEGDRRSAIQRDCRQISILSLYTEGDKLSYSH